MLIVVALFALGLAFVAPRVPWSAETERAAISRSGVLDGAEYIIEVPANWRGGLVVFAHGIQRGPGPGAVTSPPINGHILDSGHAWIASGYRAREYNPHLFVDDLVALRELFLKEIGRPRWSIVYGQSMGGHIVVASLELKPGLYQGGLAECGLVDGISIADYLLAYTAAAELISGVPLLDAPDRESFNRILNERVVPALGMPGAYTARGRQFDSVVKYLMGADQAGNDLPLRLQGLKRRYLLNMVYRDPDVEKETTFGGRAGSTMHVRYRIDPGLGLAEDELNARVRRLRPSKDGRSPSNEDTLFSKAAAAGTVALALLTKIKAVNPDVLAAATYFDDAVALSRQLKELNVNPRMYGVTIGGDLPEFYDTLKATAEYVYGATQWETVLKYPGNREFVEHYTAEFKREPSYFAASGYAGCLIFAEGVVRAGSLDADKVREQLLKLELRTPFGDFKVDQDGVQIAHRMVTFQWQKEKKVIVWPDELAAGKPLFPTPPWPNR